MNRLQTAVLIALSAGATACGADKRLDADVDAHHDRDAGADAARELDAGNLVDAATDAGHDAGLDAGDPDAGVPEACAAIVPTAGTDVTARLVVGEGLFTAIFVTAPPGDPRLFVVSQGGQVQIVRDGVVNEALFLDLTEPVNTVGSERGLLGFAFHPDYPKNGVFYVYYTADGGQSVIAEVRVSADPDLADPASLVPLLAMPDDAENHNGGMLAFGPNDGDLYASTGDDATGENAPDETSLLGKILRLTVDAAGGYGIAPDSPFGNEIFVKGLRNPWRFSFESATGDLYIGDVGQDRYEEIDWLPDGAAAGAHLGWPDCEGFECADRPTHTLPVHAYDHTLGSAVVGGYVYRGRALPDVRGTYFFADTYTGTVWGFDAGTVAENVREWDIELDAFISSFGEDGCGELLVIDYYGAAIYQIVAE